MLGLTQFQIYVFGFTDTFAKSIQKHLIFLFFLDEEKKQKKSRRKTNLHFLRASQPRKRSEKMAVRTLSPKPAALLPTYELGASAIQLEFYSNLYLTRA